MKIGIISDTHDNLGNIDKAFEILRDKQVELICHLGDWVAPYTVDHIVKKAKELKVPLKGVLGNNDGEVFMIMTKNAREWEMELGKEILEPEIDGKKIVMYHGTDKAITDALIAGGGYDLVLHGHTHVPRNEIIGKTLVVNPGTLSRFSEYRGGSLDIGELAVYDSAENKAELLNFKL